MSADNGMGVFRRDEPEKPHKDDPPCTCGCKAIIDVNRHDWRCARRLWIERNDARGAVGDAERGRALVGRMFELPRGPEWEQALAELRVWSMKDHNPGGQS